MYIFVLRFLTHYNTFYMKFKKSIVNICTISRIRLLSNTKYNNKNCNNIIETLEQ